MNAEKNGMVFETVFDKLDKKRKQDLARAARSANKYKTVDESQHPNFPQDTQETQQPLDGGCADEPETQESSPLTPPTNPSNQDAIGNKSSHAARKWKLSNTEVKSQESASSELMAYILAEKAAEKKSQQSEKHPVDAFLAGIASSLKSLDPFLLIEAKGKIFNIVQQYELEHLLENMRRGTLVYRSPGQPTITPED